MEIIIRSLVQGAKEAEGLVIIIDVFWAFTTAAVAFSKGADKIILVADVDEALALKNNGIAHFAVGEVDGIKPAGFDLGNSPFEIASVDVVGKTIVQRTSAGTLGVTEATKATKTYLGSLIIADATVQQILSEKPDLVTLVAMGGDGIIRTDEDELCAIYMKNLLEGRQIDPDLIRSIIQCSDQVLKYANPKISHFHPEDLEFALDINKLDFAISVEKKQGLLIAQPTKKQINNI